VLFLVLSHPGAAKPSAMAPSRRRFWRWIAPLIDDGRCRFAYPRVGRGVAAVFDVPSNEELHRLLTAWAEIVPARFEVHALVEPEMAKRLLN